MRQTRLSGSEGGTRFNPLSRPLCAPVNALKQWGASPHSGLDLTPIVEGNCVAARRGGEQPEANGWSVG